ncbi:Histidine-rich membrane protein KE4-like protein 1 [Diplonema papillatum]|nr:Histidine-rich membrane protein KE4-like protein 1 [Diplonema papillatum]
MFDIPSWVYEYYEKDKIAVSVTASLFTSLVPIFVILLCPSAPSRGVLHALLAFAAGSLLGDALLHLLPHAMAGQAGHDHGHSHGHAPLPEALQSVAALLEKAHVSMPHLLFLVGLLLFFFLEKILRLNHAGGHSHSHSHSAQSSKKVLGSHALLNLIADTAHNFTDGITIAAGFANSLPVGISTTLAVFIHEIPHEVGDYAVLLGSGFGKTGAIVSQVVTGCGSLAGTLIMCYADRWVGGADAIVLPISAGGFVYIATVSILPELLSSQVTFTSIVMEMLMLSLGVACMILIGLLE